MMFGLITGRSHCDVFRHRYNSAKMLPMVESSNPGMMMGIFFCRRHTSSSHADSPEIGLMRFSRKESPEVIRAGNKRSPFFSAACHILRRCGSMIRTLVLGRKGIRDPTSPALEVPLPVRG